MRRCTAATLAVSAVVGGWVGASSVARAGCADPFANPDDILDFHLRTDPATWAEFESSPHPGDLRRSVSPTSRRSFAAGTRRRSSRSRFGGSAIAARALEAADQAGFQSRRAGQRWPAARGNLGYRKLSLNSGQSDDAGPVAGMGAPATRARCTAILTEHLAWRLMREAVPQASDVAYARLTMHFTDTGDSRTKASTS